MISLRHVGRLVGVAIFDVVDSQDTDVAYGRAGTANVDGVAVGRNVSAPASRCLADLDSIASRGRSWAERRYGGGM